MASEDRDPGTESAGVTGRVLGPFGDWLDGLQPWVVVAVGLLILAGVTVVDQVTAGDVNVTIFYLGPVVLVTWLVSDMAGLSLSVLSAVLWSAVNPVTTYSSQFVPVWNTIVYLAFFFLTVFLVSLTRRAIASERAASRTDALTGLANGRAFHDRAALALAEMRRTSEPVTFGYIDLDFFKRINDTLGHRQGDQVLCVVADALRSRVRATDLVARLGGDEFGVLLPDTDYVAAGQVLAELREAVDEAVAGRWPVGMSCGAITFAAPPTGVDELLQIADERLYAAKHAGRSRIERAVWPRDFGDVAGDGPGSRPQPAGGGAGA